MRGVSRSCVWATSNARHPAARPSLSKSDLCLVYFHARFALDATIVCNMQCTCCNIVCQPQTLSLMPLMGTRFDAGCGLPAVLTQAQVSMTQQDCQHLEQLVPAAILIAAERAAEAKEQTTRHRRQLPDQAQIFADGFAIGLAVLVEVNLLCWCCCCCLICQMPRIYLAA